MTSSTPAREAILKLALPFEDFLNEPRPLPYPEPMEVRDFRHQAYREWDKFRNGLLALLTTRLIAGREEPVVAGKLTPEYLAMTPLQKWETLALHGLLGTREPWIEDMRQTLRALSTPSPDRLAKAVEALEAWRDAEEASADCDACLSEMGCAVHFQMDEEARRLRDAALSHIEEDEG